MLGRCASVNVNFLLAVALGPCRPFRISDLPAMTARYSDKQSCLPESYLVQDSLQASARTHSSATFASHNSIPLFQESKVGGRM